MEIKRFFRKTVGCIAGIASFAFGLFCLVDATVLGSNIETAWQQTVQYLAYVCAAIYLVGGCLLYQLDLMAPKKEKTETTSMTAQN